jgi:ATP-dependent helicase Lhr and Lhr-like helicase
MRRRPLADQWISLSGADPLNLIGILAPGPRLPALTDNRLIYRDGVPVATLAAGKVDFLTTLDGVSRWEAEKRLMRSAARGLLSHLS